MLAYILFFQLYIGVSWGADAKYLEVIELFRDEQAGVDIQRIIPEAFGFEGRFRSKYISRVGRQIHVHTTGNNWTQSRRAAVEQAFPFVKLVHNLNKGVRIYDCLDCRAYWSINEELIMLGYDPGNKVLLHEFGHVLGLKDCYVEITVNPEYEEYINLRSIPLDPLDWMCRSSSDIHSRRLRQLQGEFSE